MWLFGSLWIERTVLYRVAVCAHIGDSGLINRPTAVATNDVTFFSTFATNLVHAMSEIYRDICLQMQRHSRHVVTFAYLPVGR